MSFVSEGDGTWDAKKIPNAHSVSTCSSLLKITLFCNKWVNVKFILFISRSQNCDFFWAKMPPIFGGFPLRNFAFFSQFEVNFFPNYKNEDLPCKQRAV